ncbi:hypothetical protein BH11MYX4_BH11MYX4_63180 [soil metagenome]
MNLLASFERQHPTHLLFVSREGRGFRVSGGARVDLPVTSPLGKIFRTIVRAHRESPCRGLSVEEIFEAGWGRENVACDAVAGRVYCAISRLRRMGLGEVVTRTSTGYRLDSRCCVIEEGPLQRPPPPAPERDARLPRARTRQGGEGTRWVAAADLGAVL